VLRAVLTRYEERYPKIPMDAKEKNNPLKSLQNYLDGK